ncbi:hypothetical protein [Amnibacterium kyonggiense]
MSDARDETDGVGAADPITGVAAGGDDLAADTRLPDEAPAREWDEVRAEADTLVTNDAVAGETVLPGAGDGNDGPTGGAPSEITPEEPANDLQPDGIDLDDQDERAY